MISNLTLNTNINFLFGKLKLLSIYLLFIVLIWASFIGAFVQPLINTNRFLLFSCVFLLTILLNRKLVFLILPLQFRLYLVFAALAILSIIYSLDTSLAIIEIRNLIIVIFVFIGTYNFVTTINRIITVMNIFIVLLCVYALYLFLSIDIFSFGARFNFEEKSYNIIMLEFIVGVLFCFFLASFTEKKYPYYLLGILFLAIIIATGSVKGFIAISFFIVLSLIPYKFKFNFNLSIRKILKFTFLSIFVCIAIVFLSKMDFFDSGLSRVVATIMFLVSNDTQYAMEAAGSVHGVRDQLVSYGIEFWKERPIFGSGINNYRYLIQKNYGFPTYSHNTYIEILVGTGIVGFIFYFLFIISTFIFLIKKYLVLKEKSILLIIYGLVCLVIISFGQRMYAVIYQFIYIALILSFVKIKLRNKLFNLNEYEKN